MTNEQNQPIIDAQNVEEISTIVEPINAEETVTDVAQITDSVAIIGRQELQLSSQFNAILATIQPMIDQSNELLNINLSDVDEKTVEGVIKELASAKDLAKNIKEARTGVKKYFEKVRDTNLAQLDTLLIDSGYNELLTIESKLTKLKTDVLANRANERWNKLKETFDLNVSQYPIIHQFAPELIDFSAFRMRHDKLVSGAKTRNVGKKEITYINNTMYGIHEALTVFSERSAELSVPRQQLVLQEIKNEMNVNGEYANARILLYKDIEQKEEIQRQIEEEQRKQYEAEQERLRIEREKQEEERFKAAQQQKMHEQQAALPQMPQQPINQMPQQTPVAPPTQMPMPQQPPQPVVPQGMPQQPQMPVYTQPPQATNDYSWLSTIVVGRNMRDDRTKTFLLYEVYTSLTDKNSVYYKRTNNANPKDVLALTQFILNI